MEKYGDENKNIVSVETAYFCLVSCTAKTLYIFLSFNLSFLSPDLVEKLEIKVCGTASDTTAANISTTFVEELCYNFTFLML